METFTISLSPFERAMDSYYYDGRRSLLSRRSARFKEGKEKMVPGMEDSHFGYFEEDFRAISIPISLSLTCVARPFRISISATRRRKREELLLPRGGGSSALPFPLSG